LLRGWTEAFTAFEKGNNINVFADDHLFFDAPSWKAVILAPSHIGMAAWYGESDEGCAACCAAGRPALQGDFAAIFGDVWLLADQVEGLSVE